MVTNAQLREAADRWKKHCEARSERESPYWCWHDEGTKDHGFTNGYRKVCDEFTLATYAAEQLAGDGGLNWVGLDEAKQWQHGTQFVIRTKGSLRLCGAYECSFIRRWESKFWIEPEKEFAALYTTTSEGV